MVGQNEQRHRQMRRIPISRSLWDDAKKAGVEHGRVNTALLKAILYEIQPIDLMYSDLSINALRKEYCSISKLWSKVSHIADFVGDKFPKIVQFVKDRSLKEWAALIGCLLYWKTVVFLHKTLDAGPSIIIITALIAIFTVGLGDHDGNQGENGERVSAYSVFNRGFRNIMGGVDADALINQHVGGGLVVNNDAGHNMVENDDEIDGQRLRNQEVQRRRQQQHENRQRQEEPQPQEQQVQNTSRKSNKKNRRKRNIELRREMQRQRDAAAAMGFVGGGDGNNNGHLNLDLQQQDRVAMNMLLDDQIRDQSDDE